MSDFCIIFFERPLINLCALKQWERTLFIHVKCSRDLYHVRKCASCATVALSIQSPRGTLGARESLHGRLVCNNTSVRTYEVLSAQDASQTATEKACTQCPRESRNTRPHFCLLLTHGAMLRSKKIIPKVTENIRHPTRK